MPTAAERVSAWTIGSARAASTGRRSPANTCSSGPTVRVLDVVHAGRTAGADAAHRGTSVCGRASPTSIRTRLSDLLDDAPGRPAGAPAVHDPSGHRARRVGLPAAPPAGARSDGRSASSGGDSTGSTWRRSRPAGRPSSTPSHGRSRRSATICSSAGRTATGWRWRCGSAPGSRWSRCRHAGCGAAAARSPTRRSRPGSASRRRRADDARRSRSPLSRGVRAGERHGRPDVVRADEAPRGLRSPPARAPRLPRRATAASSSTCPEAPRPDPETPAPPRFLYDYENLLLSYADRRRAIVPERTARIVVRDNESISTFLVDGLVAGTWKLERSRDRATLVLTRLTRLSAGRRPGAETPRPQALLRSSRPTPPTATGPGRSTPEASPPGRAGAIVAADDHRDPPPA